MPSSTCPPGPSWNNLATKSGELSRQTGRPLVLIPESDLNDPRLLWPREHGGFDLDAQWSDDFHHALHAVLTGERTGYYADFGTLADLAKALRNAFVYDGQYSAYRRRHHGRPPVGLDGHRFLGYAQTHDQVGNRAQGERLSQLVSLGRLKIAAALVLHLAVCADALPGRGMGRQHALPILHRPPRTGPRQGRPRRPAQGIRRVRLETRRHPRSAGARDLPALEVKLGRAIPRTPCRPARLAPPPHQAAPDRALAVRWPPRSCADTLRRVRRLAARYSAAPLPWPASSRIVHSRCRCRKGSIRFSCPPTPPSRPRAPASACRLIP